MRTTYRPASRITSIMAGLTVSLASLVAVVPPAASAQTRAAASKTAVHRAITIVERITPSSKLAPDGQKYDAFSQPFLTVYAGQRVTITFENYDTAQHSFTVPQLGISETFKGAPHDGAVATKTVTLTFAHAGVYHWKCVFPCDGYSMTNQGYMTGTITVLR